MRSFLLGLVVLAVGCAESPPPPVATPSGLASPVAVKTLTIQEFRAKIVERVQKTHPSWKCATGPDKTVVTIGKRSLDLVAERSYAIYQNSPEKLEGLLADQLAGMEEFAESDPDDHLENWSQVQKYLMPSLVQKSHVHDAFGHPVLSLPFQGDLVLLFYYDHPDSRARSMLTRAIAKSWKVDDAVILETALKNLAAREPVEVGHDESNGVTVYHLDPADDYGATRIILPEARLKLARAAGNSLVVGLPSRDLAWAVAPGQAAVFEKANARSYGQATEPVTPQLFRLDNKTGALTEFESEKLPGLEETMSAPDLEAGMASFDKARPYLLPGIIRGNPSDGSAFKPLSGDLVVVYFYDHPQSTQRVLLDEKHVKGWKCTVDQIDKAARENLAKRYPIAPKEIAPGVFRLSDADDFGAARILDASGLKKLADRQKSDLLVWAPSRMLAWACRANDPKGFKALSDLAVKSVLGDPEPISPNPLRYSRATGALAP